MIAYDTQVFVGNNTYIGVERLVEGDRVMALRPHGSSAFEGTGVLTRVSSVSSNIQRQPYCVVNGQLKVSVDQRILVPAVGGMVWEYARNVQLHGTDELEIVNSTIPMVHVETDGGNYMVRAGDRHYVLEGRRHFTVITVKPFLESFLAAMGLDADLAVGTTQEPWPCLQSRNGKCAFVRKEPHEEENLYGRHVYLFVDCLNTEPEHVTYDHRYHVTWAAVSFFCRTNVKRSDLTRPLRQFVTEEKNRVCSFLYKNRGTMERTEFFQALNKRISVEIPTHTPERVSQYLFDDAVRIHAPYRFNIAFENRDLPGWVTEKLLNAFLAGAVPIYWGTRDVERYFNPKAFINAADFADFEALADYVVEVNATPRLLNGYLDEPPCLPDQVRSLFWWMES